MSSGTNVFQGLSATLNLTTATVVKPAPGRVQRVTVLVAGSAAGAVYDSALPSGNGASNQVASIPNVVGSYLIDFPCAQGICVAPGTGQTLAVSYD